MRRRNKGNRPKSARQVREEIVQGITKEKVERRTQSDDLATKKEAADVPVADDAAGAGQGSPKLSAKRNSMPRQPRPQFLRMDVVDSETEARESESMVPIPGKEFGYENESSTSEEREKSDELKTGPDSMKPEEKKSVGEEKASEGDRVKKLPSTNDLASIHNDLMAALMGEGL